MSRWDHDPDLATLVKKIALERRFGFDAYKESCLKRRVAVRMRATGVETYDDYATLLDRDAGEYEKLLDALTINVTKFYRNRETWEAIAQKVIPQLIQPGSGQLRCWSAGCASGEEPYTLAILISECERNGEQAASIAHIDASDFDKRSLDRASTGEYGDAAFEELPTLLTQRYFTGESPRSIKPEIRSMVRFVRHDITREPPPNPPYDLIMCRNVLIYFDRETQERLVSNFIDALNPGGYLVLGRAETLFGQARERLKLEDARERIYRTS
ncbi:MAG: protein-glutamate O-methyltransferase CheR [Gemmatimonadota bacterium]|nr:MAG: protein-glutamate O-methyltransferase CheR [Gemmatimonadota bacterium]